VKSYCLLGIVLLSARLGLSQTGAVSSSPDVVPRVNQGAGAGVPTSTRKANAERENGGWLEPGSDPENRLVSPFLRHLAGDQRQFWTGPSRLKVKDLKWIAPFTAVTTAFIASDSWWSKQVNPNHVQTSLHISDYGTYSLIGLGGASFLFGHISHDDHLQEAGLLSGEAAINSTGVTYLFKETAQRQRPLEGNGNGDFFKGGASFTSEHSAIAWSIASVWAHEYPGWLSQLAAYGLASAVTITRVTAKQHFPTDAVVGSALGWYFGRQVYRAHHDPEVGGSPWGNLVEENTGDKIRNPAYMASPYVSLDSWIYPALQRLIALGYMQSNMLGMRPWTRMACAQILEEAGEKLQNEGTEAGDAGKIYRTLTDEFATEITRLDGGSNVGARVDSVYTRITGISGTPVRDGYNFGQTIVDDYGRPYWTGFNNVTGVTADAEAGPVAFSFQGEYQHAPAMPSDPPQVLAAIAAANLTPALPNGTATANRFRLLNSAVLLNINNVQFSLGEQSQWLGPGQAGSLLMSDNAAPFPAFKIDDVSPHNIPGLSRLLGPFRTEFFVGQLSGQQWEFCSVPTCQSNPGYPGVVGPNISPQPFIHGEKISFQPTPNLEFGMGITAMFGGPGLPVTFGNFFRTYYIHSASAANNPGKRISAADFTYRVPGLRNWLTVYMDSLVVDEASPIGSARANLNPGFYMPRIPKVPKMELRAEGVNESMTNEFAPGFVYYDLRRYRSGYTNDGSLLANWIGRAGRGGQGWLTYSFSPRTQLQLGYRLQGVSKNFIGGGRLADYSASGNFWASSRVAVSARLQYEQWSFPVLAQGKQSNVTASLQLTYYPKWRITR
jgi:Capsule assembly protein Wzi/PAP2 superfamily